MRFSVLCRGGDRILTHAKCTIVLAPDPDFWCPTQNWQIDRAPEVQVGCQFFIVIFFTNRYNHFELQFPFWVYNQINMKTTLCQLRHVLWYINSIGEGETCKNNSIHMEVVQVSCFFFQCKPIARFFSTELAQILHIAAKNATMDSFNYGITTKKKHHL